MKIRIEIGCENHAMVFLLDEESGERVGTMADLTRIAELRSFVEEETKIESTLEAIDEVEVIIFNLLKSNRAKKPDFQLKAFRPDQVSVLKDIGRSFKILKANQDYIKPFIKDKDLSVKKTALLMESWMVGSQEALTSAIEEIILGSNNKRVINSVLLKCGVPQWIHKFLTRRTINVYPDIRRVIFPNDASKGIKLTLAEWTNVDFVRANSFLTANSGFVFKLLKDSPYLREALGTKRDQRLVLPMLNTFKPSLANVMSQEILVVPLFFGLNYYLSPGVLGKATHFPSIIKVDTDFEMLTNCVLAFIKIVTLNGVFHSQVQDFWKPVLTGLEVELESELRRVRNLYSIVNSQAAKTSTRMKLFAIQASPAARGLSCQLVCDELKLKVESPLRRHLEDVVFGFRSDSQEPDAGGFCLDINLNAYVDRFNTSKHMQEMTSPLDKGEDIEEVRSLIGLRKSSSVRDENARFKSHLILSKLTKQSVKALDLLNKDRAVRPLVPALGAWLRGFAFENLQKAAVQEILIHFARDDVHEVITMSDREDNPKLTIEEERDHY